jgi:hypothetical protein
MRALALALNTFCCNGLLWAAKWMAVRTRWAATGEGGFRQVASLASERNPACPCGVPDKSLILIHNTDSIHGGGFPGEKATR